MCDNEQFIRITELIGEMSWGIDLPSPMTVYMQAWGDKEPSKILATDPKNYEVVFDAIYQKLKNNPDYSPLREERKRYSSLAEENRKLKDQLAQYANEMMRLKGIMQMFEERLDDASNSDDNIMSLYDEKGVKWIHERLHEENK
ncbi:MAG: hypothetical protein OES84_00250 [Kiritimatiellaceae bacterium]|nr:hypothetical protein [Kiritimatiellaceae bacterium]